jgi:hypothetical protein
VNTEIDLASDEDRLDVIGVTAQSNDSSQKGL